MATKQKLAIFDCEVKTITGDAQKALLFVGVPDGYKTWQHAVLVVDSKATTIIKLIDSSDALLSKPFLANKWPNHFVKKQKYNIKDSDVTIISKLDNILSFTDFPVEFINLEETDYTSNKNTLQNYLKKHFKIPKDLTNKSFKNNKRKIAFPKAVINWDETWNSPHLTDEEKASITQDVDLDIAMANEKRECRMELEKVLNTRYFNKNFTCVGLHGNPGGGKTKMVLNDICALNHIPAVAIPCDPLMSINQMLAQVGPVNKGATVDKKELEKTVSSLKNRLTLIQQNSAPTEEEKKEMENILTALNDISSISKECAELVKTPSILMKCLKYDLPLVVFLDEVNCASTQFQNSLAPIISDGMYKDGPEVGKNKGTIKWILAWNPNTSNTKSFDGKFYDRINFIQVEDVKAEGRIAYRTRKTLAGMFGSGADYSEADKIISDYKINNPNDTEIDKIFEKVHKLNASSEALAWYVKKEIEAISGSKTKTFPKGEFETAYLGEVTLDSPEEVKKTIAAIDDLVEDINKDLYNSTKGRDTKNPDRNSFFYISDRNLDIFTDYIFSYSSVAKGVKRFIFDLIPGGNTVKSMANNENSKMDSTSIAIADNIINYLASKINALENQFFCEIPEAEKQDALNKLKDIEFEPNKWVDPTPVTNSGATASAASATATTNGSTDEMDELDSFCG